MLGRGVTVAMGLGWAIAACTSGAGTPATNPDGAAANTTPDGATAALTDISGWYTVTSFLLGPCGAPAPLPLLAPAFVYVERRQNTFVLRTCTGPTMAECTGTLFYDFTKPITNGLHAEGGIAFFSDGCTLTVERTDATLSGTTLTVKSLEDQVNDQGIAEADCLLSRAEMLTGPCTSETDLVATRKPQ